MLGLDPRNIKYMKKNKALSGGNFTHQITQIFIKCPHFTQNYTWKCKGWVWIIFCPHGLGECPRRTYTLGLYLHKTRPDFKHLLKNPQVSSTCPLFCAQSERLKVGYEKDTFLFIGVMGEKMRVAICCVCGKSWRRQNLKGKWYILGPTM